MNGSLFKLRIREYSISTYIYNKDQPNVSKFAIHGSYGEKEALLQQTLKKEYHYISTFPIETFLVDWGWQIKLNNGCE